MIYSFDTETHLIQPGLLAPPLVCGSWAVGEKADVGDKNWTKDLFKALLKNNEHIVGAHTVFDLGILAAEDPKLLDLIFNALENDHISDVQTNAKLIDLYHGILGYDEETGKENKSYSLGALVARELGIKMEKGEDSWRYRYATLESTPITSWPEEAVTYPKEDARQTLDLFLKQLSTGNPNLSNYGEQMRAHWALQLACIWGLRTNAEKVSAFTQKVETEFSAFQEKYATVGIFRKEKGRYVKDRGVLQALVTKAYQATGHEPPRNKKTARSTEGSIKTDADTLADSGDLLLKQFAIDSKIDKVRSSFISVLEQGTRVPINPSIDILKATGRVSYRSPNLQQIPSKGGVRENFVPRPGYLFCSVDYASIEQCTLAQVCITELGFSRLAEALNSGMDTHCKLGSRFLQCSYDEVLKEKKGRYKGIRDLAKAGNYGFAGGMMPEKLVLSARKQGKSFCEMAGIPGCNKRRTVSKDKTALLCSTCIEIATAVREAYVKEWEEMPEYWKLTKKKTSQGGNVSTLGSGRTRGQCGFTDGANNPFQSLAADGLKKALWYISKECYTDRKSILWGSRLAVAVHDETILEIPLDRVGWAGDRQAYLMRKGMFDAGVTQVKIEAEPALMSYWTKDAETRRDSKGLLILGHG